jgi:lipopolysaccharide export LptBFGC system permease protein LptF
MMKKILAVIVMILFAVSLVFAAEAVLPKADKNKDGKISHQEYLDASGAAFDFLDKNRDGVVTKEEMQPNKKTDADRWIREADANQDGKIHKSEHQQAARKRFFSLDKDKSGHIDRNEWASDRSDLYSPFNLFTF